jgi:hypothetical protein
MTPMRRQLRRDLRLLKIWALTSTGLLLAFGSAAVFTQATGGTKFDEISVERINIVERDGRVRLVIANGARQADAVIDGRVIVPGRTRPAGLMFFNEIGDEVGGLIFSGREQDGRPRSTGSLTFDQWKQDQTVALQYIDQDGQRRAGLAIIDRPATSLRTVVERGERLKKASSDQERAAIEKEIASSGRSAQRLFAGKDLRARSTLALSDAEGRERLVLAVEPDGRASIRFLDDAGRTVREVVP